MYRFRGGFPRSPAPIKFYRRRKNERGGARVLSLSAQARYTPNVSYTLHVSFLPTVLLDISRACVREYAQKTFFVLLAVAISFVELFHLDLAFAKRARNFILVWMFFFFFFFFFWRKIR